MVVFGTTSAATRVEMSCRHVSRCGRIQVHRSGVIHSAVHLGRPSDKGQRTKQAEKGKKDDVHQVPLRCEHPQAVVEGMLVLLKSDVER